MEQTTPMNCPSCGAAILVAARFCTACGQELAAAPDEAGSPPGPEAEAEKKPLAYLDFEVSIAPKTKGRYPVTVFRSPGGEASRMMRFPFDEAALQAQLATLQQAVLPMPGTNHQTLMEREYAVQRFGQALFEALLAGDILSRYDVSLTQAREHEQGLRLKLHIKAPDLAIVPWEYLYDARQGSYLGLSRYTPVVRYLDLQQPIQPLTVASPLRILVMLVSPTDRDPLDLEGEQRRLHAALDELEAAGLVHVTWLKGKSLDDLQEVLQDGPRQAMEGGPWHVFHFVGHGGFAAEIGEGVIALADQDGRTRVVRATQLATLLRDHQSLRLVVLNSCEGARGNNQDLFSSTASTLAREGIPAILAMQYKISDTAAVELARVFYQSLANGMPVDASLAEARKAISVGTSGTLQWGTPVLYMRSPDGVLFNFQPSRPEYWLQLGERLFTEERLEGALAAYERATRPGGTAALAYLGKGETLKRLKRFEAALSAYNQAIQLNKHLPQAYLGKAEVLESLGVTKEAAFARLRGIREQALQKWLLLFVRGSRVWMRGMAGLASLLLVNIVSIVFGFSPLPSSSPLLDVVRLHPIISLLMGGGVVAATVAALLFSRGPASQALAMHVDRPLARRLFISNSVATGSTTLFIVLLAVVLIRPPWCPTALCPVNPVLPGVHDANLDLYFTAVQSNDHVIPGDPTHYSLSNLPRSVNALNLSDPHQPPYRVVLGIRSLQQGHFGLIIQEVDLVVDQVTQVPAPLNVWAEQQRTYDTNVYQVVYTTQGPEIAIASSYVTYQGGNVQLVPGETDEIDLQVLPKVAVDLQFHIQVVYRVSNEGQEQTLTLPNRFEVISSDASNWHLYHLQGGRLSPNP